MTVVLGQDGGVRPAVSRFRHRDGAAAPAGRAPRPANLPGLVPFTADLFATGNDRDNRAAVRAAASADLDLVGIAVYGPRNAVDKVTKGAHAPVTAVHA